VRHEHNCGNKYVIPIAIEVFMKGRKKHIEYPKKISEKTEAESYEKEIE
jgi:hypothetical protein